MRGGARWLPDYYLYDLDKKAQKLEMGIQYTFGDILGIKQVFFTLWSNSSIHELKNMNGFYAACYFFLPALLLISFYTVCHSLSYQYAIYPHKLWKYFYVVFFLLPFSDFPIFSSPQLYVCIFL